MMTSKEITQRAITFTGPPRIPLTYCNRDFEYSDVLCAGYAPARTFYPMASGMTEWGYCWHSLDGTMGQPHSQPLVADAAIASYCPPDPYASGRLDGLSGWIQENQDKYLRFGLGISGFNQATFLRGFEPFLMDLSSDSTQADHVLDIVFDFENSIIDQAVTFDIDAVTFADDWGTQHGLMIAPACWRETFRPRYAEQFARIHQAGKKVWFHTCGDVWTIIGDLLDIGVDVLELLQPDLFGVERLAAEFGGHVCFCCAVDHQRRAVCGSREEIFAYTQLLADSLGKYHGGFIGYLEDYASLGMTAENYQWIRQAFHRLA